MTALTRSKGSTNLNRGQSVHSFGYFKLLSRNGDQNFNGFCVFPSTGPWTNPETGVYVPTDIGIDIVDPTENQGLRTITQLKVNIQPMGNSLTHGFLCLLLKVPQGTGAEIFKTEEISDAEIPQYLEYFNERQGLSFLPQQFVLGQTVISFSNDAQPVSIYVPGPVSLESGDRLIFIMVNINPFGYISGTGSEQDPYHITPELFSGSLIGISADCNISF